MHFLYTFKSSPSGKEHILVQYHNSLPGVKVKSRNEISDRLKVTGRQKLLFSPDSSFLNVQQSGEVWSRDATSQLEREEQKDEVIIEDCFCQCYFFLLFLIWEVEIFHSSTGWFTPQRCHRVKQNPGDGNSILGSCGYQGPKYLSLLSPRMRSVGSWKRSRGTGMQNQAFWYWLQVSRCVADTCSGIVAWFVNNNPLYVGMLDWHMEYPLCS